ncbi:hypothetical protein K470DRAFT_273375 [Piedraia hortae CBS 480.64]|uniref:Rrn9 domain-containing protein n=1 Tax=Piedraia hortae CBS 480.64 TaxID=1314780 RepID=A0A6A7BPQ9_9PEZI|nr:hypothetical protein K470DRAFT_273375 [Piedraia hortae CBS 480.64]
MDSDFDSGSSVRSSRSTASSTWFHQNHDVVQLASSLDAQRAGDLAVHLYNAHMLKVRVRDIDASTCRPPNNKSLWSKAGDQPWQPSRSWTSWPLPPDRVPRNEERFTAYEYNYEYKPSADIEDEIQAVLMRQAKDKFNSRRWTSSVDQLDLQFQESTNIHPSFLIDDDEARKILGPSIRNIMDKLDQLLHNLQLSRQHHRIGTDPQANKHKSKPDTDPSISTTDSDEPPKGKPKQNPPPAPRDWSEVLSMAALSMWDPAIVQRSARRCADLFHENMSLRVMPERPSNAINDHITQYIPSHPNNPSEDENDNVAPVGTVIRKWLCPYETCNRHHKTLKDRGSWRLHMHNLHKLEYDKVDEVETSLWPVGEEVSTPRVYYGAVHNDGFMEPIEPFEEPTNKKIHGRRKRTGSTKGVRAEGADGEVI